MPALRDLDVRSIKHSDLAALSTIEQLESLAIINPVDCSVPARLALSPALQWLGLSIDLAGDEFDTDDLEAALQILRTRA